MGSLPVSFEDLRSAAERLEGVAHRSPVLESRTADRRVGGRVFFKGENLQRVGAFKFRGAYNALSRLNDEQRRRGVLTFSSGNHAQAIALAGSLLGVPTTIVMPEDAPAIKLAATRAYGGEVVLYKRDEAKREELGARLAEERGLTIVPPYDHAHIIAGQGTAAKELFEDVGELDLLVVPCGGGGLLSGSSIAAKALSPRCRVIGVEPAAGDDGVRSFRTKTMQTVEDPDTIADGARTPSLGRLTLQVILANVSDMTSVPDEALAPTMRFFFERMKLVVEPTGCLAAAALFEGVVKAAAGARVGVIISGGNVDPERFAELIRQCPAGSTHS